MEDCAGRAGYARIQVERPNVVLRPDESLRCGAQLSSCKSYTVTIPITHRDPQDSRHRRFDSHTEAHMHSRQIPTSAFLIFGVALLIGAFFVGNYWPLMAGLGAYYGYRGFTQAKSNSGSKPPASGEESIHK